MEKIKILIVDDESRMRKLVKDFLGREGYLVDVYKRQDQQTGASFYEAGQIYAGEYRAFWPCCQLLYAFHLADQALSRSSDPPDHQG